MWRVGNIFLPDIEHIYMSEKKSNHVKEIYVRQLMNVPILAEGNVKKLLAKSAKHKQFSQVMASTDLHRIVKIPARPPSGLE